MTRVMSYHISVMSYKRKYKLFFSHILYDMTRVMSYHISVMSYKSHVKLYHLYDMT